ncbi:MAG: hypothetical protein ACI8UR_000774 [Natronomonas sp.]|jgi:hypothetical protein|uniref:DUF5793 family protein n=1 Tax=Natronomonas sp. TaxID=2184060 RepID=UPI003989377E
MRRDYFTLTVDGVEGDEAEQPVVTITYEGPTEQLESRLRKGSSLLTDEEIDVAYRLQDALEADDPSGVVALADRVTGEYVLELNADAEAVFEFVDAAREFGDTSDSEGRYRIVLETDDGNLVTYDKSTLLVYDADGQLLRSKSLIPSGVEL